MIWVEFIIYSAVIVFSAIKLAEYGDVIAIRTKLGGMLIGIILMAGATSLPELLTTINSISQGVPNLAAGNMFGSNMFNMFILGSMSLLNIRTRILRQVARRHALTGSITILMICLAIFFVISDLDIKIGWVGLDSLILIVMYIGGLIIIQSDSPPAHEDTDPKEISYEEVPSLFTGVFGFALSTALLVMIMPAMVSVSADIAKITGLGTGFIGTALVAIVTSLPELVTTIAAVRMGIYDMAVGNLFGSNMFNMFSLGVSDVLLTKGLFMSVISDDFVLVGMIGLIMTALGLIGNLAKLERKLLIFEIDALFLIITYFLGMYLIYMRGIAI